MTITKITRTKRGRYALQVDDNFLFSLHPDVYLQKLPCEGDEVTVEYLEELRGASEDLSAKARALDLLARRHYTAKQLTQKLSEKIDDKESIQKALDRMTSLGLVDDEDYARMAAADMLNLKNYAPARIRRELVQKGIDRDTAEEAAEEAAKDLDIRQRIADIIARRFGQAVFEEKGQRKAVDALYRLGYDYGDIIAVIRRLGEDGSFDE